MSAAAPAPSPATPESGPHVALTMALESAFSSAAFATGHLLAAMVLAQRQPLLALGALEKATTETLDMLSAMQIAGAECNRWLDVQAGVERGGPDA